MFIMVPYKWILGSATFCFLKSWLMMWSGPTTAVVLLGVENAASCLVNVVCTDFFYFISLYCIKTCSYPPYQVTIFLRIVFTHLHRCIFVGWFSKRMRGWWVGTTKQHLHHQHHFPSFTEGSAGLAFELIEKREAQSLASEVLWV